ncbi:MAG: AMP-binding protein [Bacteroidetes bacterium]|uniref:AMP-binding protein n=1 Tax=Candidatus Cryptobacteroides avistercoris TaxID=2840758 RepID=A0A9D9IVF6_9BACT|nr:AMP-binding protein [Candidatus Cryptobacteroides avistercoris]
MEFNSVNKLIEKSIKEHWDKDALSNYQGITLKYKDVAQRIKFLHIAFEKCGLKKGEKVALCSRNQANWGVCFLATMTYGAVPVPLLHEFKAESIHYLVNHSEAKVLFVDEVIWEGLSEQEMPELEVIVQMNTLKFIYAKSPEFQAVRDNITDIFNAMYPAGFTRDDVSYYEDSADELALINYTSGTSGFSKGVMIPYRALYSNIEFAIRDAEPQLDSNSKVVAMLPSAHMYGMMFEFLFEMTIGMHVHFLTRIPSPKIIMQAFADIHPDVIIAVPLIIEKVYKSKLKPILDRNRLFFKLPFIDKVLERKVRNELVHSFGGNFEEIILGGAAFNPEVESFFHKIGFPYTVGYGMTECAPIITYAHWDKAKLYSCGRPALNMEIRIDSPDPENVPGEVQVKGPNVFLGYYKNEEATRASFTDDGWFRTGDMGVVDKDGYLFLRGRSKCMILGANGQNIYPEELEAVINNVTYVVESLVIEDKGGLTALIYPDYHQGELDGLDAGALEKRLTDSLPEINRVLPAYAQIRRIEFMPEDFERTPKRSIKRYLYQRS